MLQLNFIRRMGLIISNGGVGVGGGGVNGDVQKDLTKKNSQSVLKRP